MIKEKSFYGQCMNTVFKRTNGNENELWFVSMDEGSGSFQRCETAGDSGIRDVSGMA
jgi:hypothetical protein